MALKATIIEFLLSQVRDSIGDLADGAVYFYEAGTTTPKNVYLSTDKGDVAANPITLDANATYQVYGDGNYKIVIKNSAGVTVYTRDNYYAGLDTTAIDWSALITAPTVPGKNYIINGNFDIWQRGTSQTSNGYGSADRWYNQNVGSTKITSRQAFTLGQTDVPNEPTYFSRTVVTSVAGAGNYVVQAQYIESVRTLAGKTATLSFYAKADATKNIAVDFSQEFGTSGSPSTGISAIGVTTCNLTTSWKKFTITVNVPSISGKTLGTDNNDSFRVWFWFDAGSTFNSRTNSLGQQSGTFDIAQVQLEEGSVATEFSLVGGSIGGELALCQRYYEKGYAEKATTAIGAAVAGSGIVDYKVTKRGVPAVVCIDAQSNSLRVSWLNSSGTTTHNQTYSIGVGSNTNNFYIGIPQVTSTSVYFTWTSDAEL